VTHVGLVARCDSGGLGVQTAEFYRHLTPDRTLVVLTDHRTRGVCDSERYGEHVTWIPGLPQPAHIDKFVDGLDVVFTAETVYSPDFVNIAHEHGCRVIVQANPEMWDGEAHGAQVVLPTPWLAERFPHATLLPVPIACDRFTARERREARRFYHPASPAMADRNGTGLVAAALRHVTADIEIVIRGARTRGEIARAPRDMPPNVKLLELEHTDSAYFDAYPDDVDVMLLPRRYGGLCLPAQEAAAQGIPVVMSDLAPQAAWPHVEPVPVARADRVRMKGGLFDAYSVDPRVLAATIDDLATNPQRVQLLSRRALAWADEMSWERWAPRYRALLCPS